MSVNVSVAESDSRETAVVQLVAVTAGPVGAVVLVLLATALLVRVLCKRRRGNQRYQPVPTKPETSKKTTKQPNPCIIEPSSRYPIPRIQVTLATNFSKTDPRRQTPYLPHTKVKGDDPVAIVLAQDGGGVADGEQQARLHITVQYSDERKSLEIIVDKLTGLPHVDDPYVKLSIASRDTSGSQQPATRSCCTRRALRNTAKEEHVHWQQESVECGPVTKEELSNAALAIQVMGQEQVVLGEAELLLRSLSPSHKNSIAVILDTRPPAGQSPTAAGHGQLLVSLFHDTVSCQLRVTIAKIELHSATNKPSNCFVKVSLMKGGKCVMKENTRPAILSSGQATFNCTILIDATPSTDMEQYSLQCSTVSSPLYGFMKRDSPLGVVTLGSHAPVQHARRHWEELVKTHNTSIAEWHDLL